MRINSRMGDLFRVSTEVFLITTIVGMAEISKVKTRKSETPAHFADRDQQTRIPQPGSGVAAVIVVDAVADMVEVEGRRLPLAQFLRGGDQPERVILKLKGTQWKELTTLVRSRDLHFIVETEP